MIGAEHSISLPRRRGEPGYGPPGIRRSALLDGHSAAGEAARPDPLIRMGSDCVSDERCRSADREICSVEIVFDEMRSSTRSRGAVWLERSPVGSRGWVGICIVTLALAAGCGGPHPFSSGATGSSIGSRWPRANACSIWPLAQLQKVVGGATFSHAHPFTRMESYGIGHQVSWSGCNYDNNRVWTPDDRFDIHLEVWRVADQEALFHSERTKYPTLNFPATDQGSRLVTRSGSIAHYHVRPGNDRGPLIWDCTNGTNTAEFTLKSDLLGPEWMSYSDQATTLSKICDRF